MTHCGVHHSAFGDLLIAIKDGYIVRLEFREPDSAPFLNWCRRYLKELPKPMESASSEVCELFNNTVAQLEEYFSGARRMFDLPILLHGTEFQRTVWEELKKIPYGETCTYRDIANRIGNPKGVRPVGGANHHNPVSIIVPCHRVIGADGSLTGYGGGLSLKRALLDLESAAG
ncbi:methylated-DNA--[protein]-cysteine S-methyltransferase [Oscillospiraceae bacterium OttesenSCG-928-G22]|nr:methylated-DNA--[protein]-cysteine S-methyltransferase [Oscillospiraceae bacterium OttesenSCG-928-G22]